MYFSGQGVVTLAPVDNDGNIGARTDMGCLDALSIALNQTRWKRFEKCSGKRLLAASGVTSTETTGSGTAVEWSPKAMAQLLQGALKSETADTDGTVTGEKISGEVDVGDYYDTKRVGISSVVITDSAGSPVTVTNTKYAVTGANGRITFNNTFDPDDYTFPLKVSYSYAEPNYVALFGRDIQSVNLRYAFTNSQSSAGPGIVELYKVNISPATGMELINDEAADFPFTFEAIADTSRSDTGPLGQFGRILDPAF